MMCSFLILGTVLLQAGPPDPKQEIDRLRKENRELRDHLDVLTRSKVEDARAAKRHRQIIKALREELAEARKNPPPEFPPQPPPDEPEFSLKGTVVFVEPKLKFVMIDKGERAGVKAGYRFEITRAEKASPGAESRPLKIATAVFEKWMGVERSMSKLKIVEGKASDVRLEDQAVAIRKVVKTPPSNAKPVAPKSGGPDVYQITGRAGRGGRAGYVINYGKRDGAVQTAIVYAYRDGDLQAKLRLDTVTEAFSVGNVIDGSLVSNPKLNDPVYLKPLDRKQLTGKIVARDPRKERVALDLRRGEGAREGQRYEVRRHGRKIGVIVLSKVETWGSWADAIGATPIEDLKKGDRAILLEE